MLTDNDIMEELSLAYVRAVASRAGFAVEEIRRDRDSVDLHICARGPLGGGLLHSPVLGAQLKATATTIADGDDEIAFDLKIKNYTDLIQPTAIPRVLVVFAMPEDPERWLSCSEEALVLRRAAYWAALRGLPASSNTSTVRVRVPRAQVLDVDTIRGLLARISRQEEIVA